MAITITCRIFVDRTLCRITVAICTYFVDMCMPSDIHSSQSINIRDYDIKYKYICDVHFQTITANTYDFGSLAPYRLPNHHLSIYPTTICPFTQPPSVHLPNHHLSIYPTTICPFTQPPSVHLPNHHLSIYLTTICPFTQSPSVQWYFSPCKTDFTHPNDGWMGIYISYVYRNQHTV